MAIDARGYTYSDLTGGRVKYDLLTEERVYVYQIGDGVQIGDGINIGDE